MTAKKLKAAFTSDLNLKDRFGLVVDRIRLTIALEIHIYYKLIISSSTPSFPASKDRLLTRPKDRSSHKNRQR
jgi:hypothetical protein